LRNIIRKNRSLLNCLLLFTLLSGCFLIIVSVPAYKYNKPIGYEEVDDEILEFDEEFFWGAATASYQVEGGNIYSNWWRFEQEEGNIKNGDTTEVAVDHYDKYREDIDLMEEMGLNSYRFSIEWSRIEPEKDIFDYNEIEHYRDVIDYLNEKDIEPMVTLWHHSLPIWFEDQGGWEKENSIEDYLNYVEYVVSNLDDEVEFWITMNEPMAYITCGYISSKWPPAKKEYIKIPKLVSNISNAHKQAYGVIHNLDPDAQVGLAEHSSYVVPYHEKNVIENIAAYAIDKTWVHYLINQVHEELDFIGVHYYYKQSIDISLAKDVLTKSPQEIENQSLDRSYYPQGLFEVLMRFKDYNIPIYITEIGVPDYHEIDRDQFIREHAVQVYYANKSGADVRGFYYWSLLDCFEWTEGYDAKFGLISVDMETQERTVKGESWEYADIAKCNCVENY